MEGASTPSDVLAGYLSPGETMLWCGQPRRGVFLTRGDIFVLPFFLAFGGFAIFWESMAAWATMSLGWSAAPMLLAGVPFVLIGLYLTVGRLFVDARLRARTFYGLTDRRVLIVRRPPLASVRTIDLDRLADMSFSQDRAGRGTIVFHAPARVYDGTGGRTIASLRAPDWTPVLFAIEDVRSVFSAIQQRILA